MVPLQLLPEFEIMLFCSVAVPLLKIPPEEFPLTVLLLTATLPEALTIAPPAPPHVPEQRYALLPVTVLLFSVTVPPEVKNAPPTPTLHEPPVPQAGRALLPV